MSRHSVMIRALENANPKDDLVMHNLGEMLNEHLEIASYITDDGNPVVLIDAAVRLVERVLPGWFWVLGTCCVSDDARMGPDHNSPEHGERLHREFDPAFDWAGATDIDLRPSGRPAVALCLSLLTALELIEERAGAERIEPSSQTEGNPSHG